MKVSELLIEAKKIWFEGRYMAISYHDALRKVTDDYLLRSDARMFLGRAHFTEEEKIDRAITLAAIDEAGLGGLEYDDMLVRKFLKARAVEDPPEGPETW